MNNRVENLDIIANISQLFSLYLLLNDATNSKILKELERQNKIYFEQIIKDLNEIKKKLDIKESERI